MHWQLITQLAELKKYDSLLTKTFYTRDNVCISNTINWLQLWIEHFWQPNWLLQVYILFDKNTPVAFCPFYLHKPKGLIKLITLYPIGQGEPEASEIASEYNDIYILVGYENEVLQLLSKELKTLKIDQIKWRATLHNSHINRLLKTTFNYQPAATSARYIIKRDCWSFERLSKNTRDRYKRSVRQLNKVNATFQWIAAADFEHYAGRLAQFHQARWNKIGHAGAFAESDFNAFHKNYRTNHPNHINISAIVVDNQPIAINYYLADKTTLYFYQCGWDESNYAKFSPGFALHIWSIEHCKLEYYDFMMGGLNDSYKAKFGCKKIPMANNHVILTKWKFHVNRLINKITKYLKP